MRRTDFLEKNPSNYVLKEGDILRSRYGSTYRIIMSIDGKDYITEGTRGTISVLRSVDIANHWVLMVPKDA